MTEALEVLKASSIIWSLLIVAAMWGLVKIFSDWKVSDMKNRRKS